MGQLALFLLVRRAPLALCQHVHSNEWSGTGWDSAANSLLELVNPLGLKRGQIVSIDAHNNGNGAHDMAMFVAHYVQPDAVPSGSPRAAINYHCVENRENSWSRFCRSTARYCNTMQQSQVV